MREVTYFHTSAHLWAWLVNYLFQKVEKRLSVSLTLAIEGMNAEQKSLSHWLFKCQCSASLSVWKLERRRGGTVLFRQWSATEGSRKIHNFAFILSVLPTLCHISARKTASVSGSESQAAPAVDFNSPCLCRLPLLCCCSYCLRQQVWKEFTMIVSPWLSGSGVVFGLFGGSESQSQHIITASIWL